MINDISLTTRSGNRITIDLEDEFIYIETENGHIHLSMDDILRMCGGTEQ